MMLERRVSEAIKERESYQKYLDSLEQDQETVTEKDVEEVPFCLLTTSCKSG